MRVAVRAVYLASNITLLMSCGGVEQGPVEAEWEAEAAGSIGVLRAALTGVDAKIEWDGWKGPAVRLRLSKSRTCQLIYDPGSLARTIIATAVTLFTNPVAGLVATADLTAQTLWIKSRQGIDGVSLYFNVVTGRLYRVERRGCASTCGRSGCAPSGGTFYAPPPCRSATDCPRSGLCLRGRCAPACGPNAC